MVGHGQSRDAALAPPAVSQLATGHLDRLAGRSHAGGHVKVPDLEGYAEPSAKLSAETLVAVALVAPQVEVAVKGADAHAHVDEHAQQRHGVGSPAQPHGHGGAVGRQERMEAAELGDDGGQVHASSAISVADDAETTRTLTVSPTR